MLLRAGARATVHDTVFTYNRADEGSVAGLMSTRGYVDRIGAVVWFHDCSFVNNTESDPSMVAIEDLRGYAYTNTDGLTVWETRCDDEYKTTEDGGTYKYHCKLKPYKLAPLSAGRQEGSREDVFAHVAAAAQALPRPSDPAFRQVVGEQMARSGMTPLDILDLPSGIDMTLVDGPWGNGALGWFLWLTFAAIGCPWVIIFCHTVIQYGKLLYPRLLGIAMRGAKAMQQWAADVLTEVKEARAKPVECNTMTSSADEMALEAAVWQEHDTSNVVDASIRTAPIPDSFLQSM